MPARIVRPVVEQEEQLAPEAGDIVEHFAFGRCEVVMLRAMSSSFGRMR